LPGFTREKINLGALDRIGGGDAAPGPIAAAPVEINLARAS
jgi:hypothetical protein